MNEIVLPDDYLKHLEKRFGPSVRQMGPWNSDGTFGYCTVPLTAVEKAAGVLNDAILSGCLQELREAPDKAVRFIDLLQTFGPALIDEIIAAHAQRFRKHVVSRPRSAANVA